MSYFLVSKWYLNVFQFCLLPGVLADVGIVLGTIFTVSVPTLTFLGEDCMFAPT